MSEVTTTYLEITSIAELRPKVAGDARFEIREATIPQWQLNRFLYLFVGEPWDWTDKRDWPDKRWQDYAHAENLRTYVGMIGGSIAGYYELQKKSAEVEIAYFGLTRAFIGRGLGGALLTSAIEQAFDWNATRVCVHTCTRDHPAALQNYLARGMLIFKTSTEQRPE